LDDAAFSVGAFIHQQTRSGSRLVVMTVLANDPAPTSDEPGSWDLACGFKSAAVAARTRREEDRQACAKLGATPVWLPYGDETYDRGASEAAIWAEVVAAIRDADTVLVPGYPLTHPDHLWVTKLVLGRRSEFDGDLGLYAEQPYAAGTLLSAHRRNASARPSVKLGRDMIEFAALLLSVDGPPPSPTASLRRHPSRALGGSRGRARESCLGGRA